MKTYKQRTEEILNKVAQKRKTRRNRRIAAACCCFALVLSMSLVLFVPYDVAPSALTAYKNNPYFDVIEKLYHFTYRPPAYKNNFEKWFSAAKGSGNLIMGSPALDWADEGNGFLSSPDVEELSPSPEIGTQIQAPGASAPTTGKPDQTYEEVTDNQVEGVIEGDIFKRSDKYIYYLVNNKLSVYSIAQENSQEVGSYDLLSETTDDNKVHHWVAENAQMYLSQDCTTLTVLRNVFTKTESASSNQVCLLTLDVTDPKNIQETNRVYVDGSYVSSRMVDGKLLLLTDFAVRRQDIDYSEESTFLPHLTVNGEATPIPAENIYCPDTITSTKYTVVCRMDGKTLETEGSAAFLSYSNDVYVSKEHVFAVHNYTDTTVDENGYTHVNTMSEIACLSYTGEELTHAGSICVKGSIKDQYSMDAYQGILRIVTSTSETSYLKVTHDNGTTSSVTLQNSKRTRNVSLYCVDMATWQIAASVEGFAPENETAESVRFDGTNAYVCTAEVITLTDPVYFFDLSDLNNITWKDTGTIDGYSSSLVNFGDGYLLGIGFGGTGGMKIEVYRETETKVESVCAFEKETAIFSQDYKDYFIDRENQLVGLGYQCRGSESRYVLLLFTGEELVTLLDVDLGGYYDQMRAFLDNGWMYMLGENFIVRQIYQ